MQEHIRAHRDAAPMVASKLSPRDWAETRVLGCRYKLQHLIGRGPGAEVYLGDDLLLERAVVIKISHDYVDLPGRLERFRCSAIALAAVRSPNLVNIYDIGVTNGAGYLVLQYVEGQTIQDQIRRSGPLSYVRATTALTQLLAGLAAMHDQGVVHGDIRASNVLLAASGKVVLMDLGIVLDVGRTQSTVGTGTPSELTWQPSPVRTFRCDVYDVGLLMLLMLTGVDAGRRSQRLGFEDLLHRIPVPLATVARRSLDTDPAGRYSSATVMGAAIEAALA